MLKDNNSIIVVDNKVEDLEKIARVFNVHGIGCRTIECNGYDLLPEPLKGVKIAFFDIDFIGAGDETAIFSALRSVLTSTISKDNGPFVLVFWTTNPQFVSGFKEFVNRDETYKNVPNPIFITTLDKSEFEANPDRLSDSIEHICACPLAKCLISFSEELQTASDSCMQNITSLITVDEPWGVSTKYEKRFKEIFSRISIDTLGMTNGRAYPDLAIKESLAPLFGYNLCNNGGTAWKSYLDLENVSKSKLNSISISDIAPSLNSIYHIDFNIVDPFARGTVRKIDCENDIFANRIGFSKDDWVYNRFLKIQFKISYELIALEFSAACDYANDKCRLHKFLLGIICSKDDAALILNSSIKISGNVYSPEFVFRYNDCENCIFVDLNSVISEEDNEMFKMLGKPLFKFKHEIMNVITTAHANHESRLGYSKFK